MKISIDIPPRVYGQLADLADAHGVRINDLIAETVAELLGPRPKRGPKTLVTPELQAEIRVLVALNRSQKEIACALGVSESTVGKAMKRMGLQNLNGRTRSMTKPPAPELSPNEMLTVIEFQIHEEETHATAER